VKLLHWLLLLPLTVIFVAFAIANRQAVTLSLDPAPLSIEAPLFGLIFAGVFAGLVAGGLIAWVRAGRWRRRLRDEQKTVRRLEGALRTAESAAAKAESQATGVVKAA
jgi:uncharacterized integral membrane protein